MMMTEHVPLDKKLNKWVPVLALPGVPYSRHVVTCCTFAGARPPVCSKPLEKKSKHVRCIDRDKRDAYDVNPPSSAQ